MRTPALFVTSGLLAFGANTQASPQPDGELSPPSGSPWVRHTIDAGSRGADGVRVADLNRDQLPDLVTGWEEGGQVRAYLNPGPVQAKHPWPKVIIGSVASPEDAVFADVPDKTGPFNGPFDRKAGFPQRSHFRS